MRQLFTLFLFMNLQLIAAEFQVIKINDRIVLSDNFLKGEVFGHTVGNGFGLNKTPLKKYFECESLDQEIKVYFYQSEVGKNLYSVVKVKGLESNFSEFLTIEALEMYPGKMARSIYSGVNAERKDYFYLKINGDLAGSLELKTQYHQFIFDVSCSQELKN